MWALDSETSKKMSEHLRFQEHHCHSAPHILGTPTNIRINLIFLESSIIELHFARDSFCLSSFKFLWQAPKGYFISAKVTFRPFKVVDFGASRKRIRDCSTLILGMFSLHQVAHVGVSPHTGPKLFGHEIIFQEFQPMWSRYLNVMDRQTDGRTDRRTTYCGITALCIASRGKN